MLIHTAQQLVNELCRQRPVVVCPVKIKYRDEPRRLASIYFDDYSTIYISHRLKTGMLRLVINHEYKHLICILERNDYSEACAYGKTEPPVQY